MGEKQANRRALIEKVQDCIAQTNAMTTLATEVREANNRLAEQAGQDVTDLRASLQKLTERADAHRAWFKKIEAAHDREQTRLTRTRIDVGQTALEQGNFTLMSFWQRLRWLLTGHWPRPLPGVFAAAPESYEPTVIPAVESPAKTYSSECNGYIPDRRGLEPIQ